MVCGQGPAAFCDRPCSKTALVDWATALTSAVQARLISVSRARASAIPSSDRPSKSDHTCCSVAESAVVKASVTASQRSCNAVGCVFILSHSSPYDRPIRAVRTQEFFMSADGFTSRPLLRQSAEPIGVSRVRAPRLGTTGQFHAWGDTRFRTIGGARLGEETYVIGGSGSGCARSAR